MPKPTIKLPEPDAPQSGDATLPPTNETLVNENGTEESTDGDSDSESSTEEVREGQAPLDDKVVIERLRAQRTNLQAELKEAKYRANEAERKVKSLGKEARRMRMFDSLLTGFAANGQFNLGVQTADSLPKLMQHIAGLAQVAEKKAEDSGF